MNDDPVAAALAGGQIGDDDEPDIYSYKKGQTVEWPFKATVNSIVGESRDGGKRKHTGVDFGGKRGTPIPHPTSRDGIVTEVGSGHKLGNYVRVDDGVWEYSYGHLDKVDVAKDGHVTKGQQLGLLGATGNATGPNVHITRRPSRLGREGVKARLASMNGSAPSSSSDPVAAALAGTPPASSEPFQSDPGRLAGMMEMAGDVAMRHDSLGKNRYETPLGTEYTATDGLADQAHAVGFRVPRQQQRRVVRRVAAPVVSKEARAIGQAGSSLARAGAPIASALSGVVGQIAPFVGSVTGPTPRAKIPNAARRNRDFVTGSMGRAPGDPGPDSLNAMMARGHDPRMLAPRIEPSNYLAPSHSTSLKTGKDFIQKFDRRTRASAAPVSLDDLASREHSEAWANLGRNVSTTKGLDALAPPSFAELVKRDPDSVKDPLSIPMRGLATSSGEPVPAYASLKEYYAQNPDKAPPGWGGLKEVQVSLIEALTVGDPVGALTAIKQKFDSSPDLDFETRETLKTLQDERWRKSTLGKAQRELALSVLDMLMFPAAPQAQLGHRAFEKSEQLRAYGRTPEGKAWLKSLGWLENPVRGIINGLGSGMSGLMLNNLENYQPSLRANPNAPLPGSTEFIGGAANMVGKAVPQFGALALGGAGAAALGLEGAAATSVAGGAGLYGSEYLTGQDPESPVTETSRERDWRAQHAGALGLAMGPIAASTAPYLDPLVARGEKAIAEVAGRTGGSTLNRAGQKVAAVVEKLAIPSRVKSGVDMFGSTYAAAMATGQPLPSLQEGALNAGMGVLTGPEWNRFHTAKAIKARAAEVEAGRAPKPPTNGDVVELGRAGGEAPVYGQIEHISPNGAVTVRLEDGKTRFLSPKSQETTGLRVLDPQHPEDRTLINQLFPLTADEGPRGGVVPIAPDPVAEALAPTLGPEQSARLEAAKTELESVRQQIRDAGGSENAPMELIDRALDLRLEIEELTGAEPMVPGERTLGPEPTTVATPEEEAPTKTLGRDVELTAEQQSARAELVNVDKTVAELEARIAATGGPKKSPLHLRKNLERLQIKRETLVAAAGLEPAAPPGSGITSEPNAETPAAVPGPGNRQSIISRPSDEEWASWTDDQKRAHNEQVHQALRVDPKTGAGNHVSFREAVEHVRSTGREPTVSVVDLNALHAIQNAMGGHAFGDAIIQAAVDALHEAGLLPHRIGGDEFAIVGDSTPEVQQAQVERALEGLRRKQIVGKTKDGRAIDVSNLSWSHGTDVAEPGSVIVERGQHVEGAKDVLEGADAKLYEHKTSLEGTDRAPRNPDGSPASRDAIPPSLNVRVRGDAAEGGDRPGLPGDQGQGVAAKKGGAPAPPEPPARRRPTFDELDDASSQAPKKGSVKVEIGGQKYTVNSKGEVRDWTGNLVYHPDAGVVDGPLLHTEAEDNTSSIDRPVEERADGTEYPDRVEDAAHSARIDPLLHVSQPERAPQGLRLNPAAAALFRHLLGEGPGHDITQTYALTLPMEALPDMIGRAEDLLDGGTLSPEGTRMVEEALDILRAMHENPDGAVTFTLFNIDDVIALAKETGDTSHLKKLVAEEIAHGWQWEDVYDKSGRLDAGDWLPPDVAAKMPHREKIAAFLVSIGYGNKKTGVIPDRVLLLEATAQFFAGQDIGLTTHAEKGEFARWLKAALIAEHGADVARKYVDIPVDVDRFMRDYGDPAERAEMKERWENRAPDDLSPPFDETTGKEPRTLGRSDDNARTEEADNGPRTTVHEGSGRPTEPVHGGEDAGGRASGSRRDVAGRREAGKTLGRSRTADEPESVEGPRTLGRSDVDVPAPVEEGSVPRTLGPSSAPDAGGQGLAAVRSPERRGAKRDTDEHVYFEIAPSKSTKYAAAWHAQDNAARARSSYRIAEATLPKILDVVGLGNRGLKIQHTVGGYMLETNPSTRVSGRISSLKAQVLASAIGYTYRQDSVLVARLDATNGDTDYVTVTFPKGELTTKEADAFFQHLGKVNKSLGGGYAVKDDTMLLLNVRGPQGPYSGLNPDQFEELVHGAAESYDSPIELAVERGRALAAVTIAENDWETQPNGEGYQAGLHRTRRPEVARALDRIRREVDAFHDQIAAGGIRDEEADASATSGKARQVGLAATRERFAPKYDEDEDAPGRSRFERTPEFKAFFEKSAVAEEDGTPLVVSHYGHVKDIEIFDRLQPEFRKKGKEDDFDSVGNWFAANRDAKDFGPEGYHAYLSIQNPKRYTSFKDALDDFNQAAGRKPGTVRISYAARRALEQYRSTSLSNHPGVTLSDGATGRDVVISGQRGALTKLLHAVQAERQDVANGPVDRAHYAKVEQSIKGALEKLTAKQNPIGVAKNGAKNWRAQLKAEGYDGIIISEETGIDRDRPQTYYVALEPTQIKQIGNKGTFDKTNANSLAATRHERPRSAERDDEGQGTTETTRPRRRAAQPFYYEGERAVETVLGKLKGEQLDSAKLLAELGKAGASKGDVYELGLEDLIRRSGASVSRAAVMTTVAANHLEVVAKPIGSGFDDEDSLTAALYEMQAEYRSALRRYEEAFAETEEEVSALPDDVVESWATVSPVNIGAATEVAQSIAADGEHSRFYSKVSSAPALAAASLAVQQVLEEGSQQFNNDEWWDMTPEEFEGEAPDNFEAYTHPGGTNYRVVTFAIPGRVFYTEPHFNRTNVIAHARLKTRQLDGEPYEEVAEVQSELHQAGREAGYQRRFTRPEELVVTANPFTEERNRAGEKYAELTTEVANSVKRIYEQAEEAPLSTHVRREMYRYLLPTTSHSTSLETLLPKKVQSLPEWQHFKEVSKQKEQAFSDYIAVSVKESGHGRNEGLATDAEGEKVGDTPDVPFKTTWYQLVLKHLIRQAIENGSKGLLINSGDEVTARFTPDKFLEYLDYNVEATAKRVTDGEALHTYKLHFLVKGAAAPQIRTVVGDTELGKLVGKELAKRIVAGEGVPEGEMTRLAGDDLAIRQEGLRVFYDQTLPNFLTKYARRMGWNTKPEKIKVPLYRKYPDARIVERKDAEGLTEWHVVTGEGSSSITHFVGTTELAAKQRAEFLETGGAVEMWQFPIPAEMREDILENGQGLGLAAVRRKEPPRKLEEPPIRKPYSMAIDLAMQRVLAPDTKAISIQSLEKQLLRYGATKADLIATGVTDLVEDLKEAGAKRVDRAQLEEVVAANLAKWTPVARLTGPSRDEAKEPFEGDYWGIEDDEEFDELNEQNTYQRWSTANENRFYREELLELPRHELHYENPHFDNAHAFSHNRAQDRVWNGDEWLEVLEIQSDLHQDARQEGGYRERPTSNKATAAFKARVKAANELDAYIAEQIALESKPITPEVVAEVERRNAKLKELREAADNAVRAEQALFPDEAQPWSPYQKTWWQLHLKRLIQEAIDNNQKGLLINSGETQRRRFGLDEHLSKVDVTIKETFEHPKNQGVIYKLEIWRPNHGAHQTVMVDDRTTSSDRLDRYVGEEVAERIRRQMQGGKVGDRLVLNRRDLATSESKHGHFYDVMIPSFLEKYAKRLGFKARVRPVTIRTIAPAPKGYFRAVKDDRKYEGVERWNVFVGDNEVPKAFYYSKEEADAYIARQEAGNPELMWEFEIPDGMREQLRETGQVIGLAALRRPLDRSVIGKLNQSGETAEKSVKQRRETERVSLERLIPQLAKVGAKLLVAPEVTTRAHWNAGMEKRFGKQFARVSNQVYNEALEVFGAEARAARVAPSRARGLALRKAAGGAIVPNRLELFKKVLDVERTRGDEASLASIASHLEAFILGTSGRLEPLENPNAPQNAGAREKRVDRAARGMEIELARIVEEIQAQRHTKTSSGLDWYKAAIRRTVRIMTELYPTLKDPDHALLFKILLGPTSPNEKPFSNLFKAAKLYEGWLKSASSDEERVFPLRRKNGKRWGFVGLYGAIHRLEGLIRMFGYKEALKWLKKRHPLGRPGSTDPNTLRYWKPSLAPADLHGQHEGLGLFIFGPKAGPFASNILGINDYLTVDLWATRTYNALMGTLVGWETVDKELEKQLDKAGTWGEENVDWRWHPTDKGRKQRWAPIEQPRNEGERQIIIDAFVRATRSIAARFNVKLEVPDAQALLWFAEQYLYRAHGAKNESWTFDQAALEYVRQHGILANSRGVQPRHTAAGSRVSGVAAEVHVPRPRTIWRAEATPAGTAPSSATAAVEKANSVVVRLPAPGVTGVLRLNPPAAALAHQLFGWGPASEINWTGKVVDIGLLADMLPRLRTMATSENLSANARQRAAALLAGMTDIVLAGGTGEKRAAVSVELRNLDGLSKANAEKTLKELELRGIIFEEIYKRHESRKDGSILKETKKARLPHQKELLERLEDEGYEYTTDNAMLLEVIPRVFGNNETFGLEGKALIDLRAALGRILKENLDDATAKRFRKGVTPDLTGLSGAYPRPGRKPIELAPDLTPADEEEETGQERSTRAKRGALAAVRRAPRPFFYGAAEKAREILKRQKGETVNPDAFLKAAASAQIPKGDLVELGLAKLLVPGGRSIPKDYLEALIAANEIEVEVVRLGDPPPELEAELDAAIKKAEDEASVVARRVNDLRKAAVDSLTPHLDSAGSTRGKISFKLPYHEGFYELKSDDPVEYFESAGRDHFGVELSGPAATPELKAYVKEHEELERLTRIWEKARQDKMRKLHADKPQYGKYAPTDKTEYFELLFRLPVRSIEDFPDPTDLMSEAERQERDDLFRRWRDRDRLSPEEYESVSAQLDNLERAQLASKLDAQAMYTATHWGHMAARTFAHTRASVRELDGKRYLHVHEVQSDLQQRYKKYGIKGQPPPAPAPLTEFPKGEGQFVIAPVAGSFGSYTRDGQSIYDRVHEVRRELKRRAEIFPKLMRDLENLEALSSQREIAALPGYQEANKWLGAHMSAERRLGNFENEPSDKSEFLPELPAFPLEFVKAARKMKTKQASGDTFANALAWWFPPPPSFELQAKVPTKVGHKLVSLGTGSEEELRGPLGVGQINTYLQVLHKQAVADNDKYGVPDVPFKTTWHEFILKRLIQVALDAGLDGLIIDNGETNSDRFRLDREIKSLRWTPKEGTTKGRLYAEHKTDGSTVFDQTIEEAELPEYVGGELAPKLIEAGTLVGQSLRVPGKGQKEFYDQKVQNFLNKYSRRHNWGAKVEETRLRKPLPKNWYVAISPERSLEWGEGGATGILQKGTYYVTDLKDSWFHAVDEDEAFREIGTNILPAPYVIELRRAAEADRFNVVVRSRDGKDAEDSFSRTGGRGLNKVGVTRFVSDFIAVRNAGKPPAETPLDKLPALEKGWKFDFTDKLKEDVTEKGQDLSLAAMRRPNPSPRDETRAEPARINAKAWYHGTGKAGLKASSIDPLATNIESIFGFGFYTTDNRAVARTYAEKKGKKSGTPRVYKLQVDVTNVLDLELPAPPAVRSLFKKLLDDVLEPVDAGVELEETLANRNATTEELYYSYKHDLADYSYNWGVSKDEISEYVADFLTELRDLGFDAVMHTGGWRTQSEAPHEVLILLDPNETITTVGRPNRVTAMDEEGIEPPTRTEARTPGQAPIAGAGGEPHRPRRDAELEDDAITGILEEGDYGLAAKRRPKLAKDDEMTRIEKAQHEARNPGMLKRFKTWAAEQPERARNAATYTLNMFARTDKLVHQVQERVGILLPSQNPTVRNALYYGGGAGVVEAMFRDFLDIQRDAIKQGLDHALSRLLNLHAYDRAYKTKREHMATILEEFAQDAVDQLPTLVFRTLRDNGHLSPQNFAEVQRIHAAGTGAPSVRLKMGLWRISRRNWERANIAGAVVGLRPGKTVVWDKRWMKDHRELNHIRRDIKFSRIVPEHITESMIQLKLNNLYGSLDPDQVTQLNALADRHYALNRTILDTAYDAGIISAKAYATMTKRGDRYVPLSRIMDTIEEHSQYKPTPDGLDLAVQKILYQLKGSEKYNVDPIIASMARAQETIREASANLAALTFIELRNHDPMLAGIIHVRAEGEKLEPGMGELAVFDNGRVQKWIVPEAVAREMHLATAAQARVMGQAFIGFVNHVFKAGATGANLAFALPNVARDLRDWVAFAEHAPRLYKPHELAKATGQYLASLYHVLRKDQVYREWLRSGAAYSTRQKFFTPEDFLKTFWGDLVARPWKAPLAPLHAVTHVVSALEETTKLTAFRRAKKGFLKEGFAPDEAQIAAAYESRTYGGSHDFAIGGSYAPQMNLVMPFIRARLGGTRRAVRTFSGADLYLPGARGGLGGVGGNPNAKRKGWARLLGKPGIAPVRQLQAQRVGTALFRLFSKMATATVLGGLYYRYGIQPYEEDYKKIPPSERDSNWIVFTNEFEELPNGEMKRVGYKIPMSHVDQMFFPAIVSMYRHFGTGAPEESFENIAANELLQFSPVGINRGAGEPAPRALFRAMVSNMTPLLRSPAEQMSNWDTFRDMSIESAWMQEVDPSKRFVAGRTSPAYIKTAEYADYLIRRFSGSKQNWLINNPVRLQKLVEDVTGGASKMGTDLVDAAIEDAPLANMDRKAKIPILGALQRRFIVSSTNDVLNQQNERFYKNLELAGESIRSFRRDGENLGAAEAARYLEDPLNFRAAAFSEELAQIARGQAILRSGYNAIAKHETMSIPEKRAAMKELVAEEKRLLERAEEIDKIMKGKRPDSLVSDETAATFRYNVDVELEKFRILERFRTSSDFKGVSQLEQERLKDRVKAKVDAMRLDPYQERKPAAPEGVVKPGEILDFAQKQKDLVQKFARLQAGQIEVDGQWMSIDRWLAEGAP